MLNWRYFKELRFALIFLLVFAGLHALYEQARGGVIERAVIDHATVAPAADIINLIAPHEQVNGVGHRLVSPTVRISVLNGCEGTETLFLLVAAIIAFPASWRQKLVGVLLGGVLVYVLNQARITGLYFALRYDKGLFEALHGYIGPTLIIALASLFFVWWAGSSNAARDASARPA